MVDDESRSFEITEHKWTFSTSLRAVTASAENPICNKTNRNLPVVRQQSNAIETRLKRDWNAIETRLKRDWNAIETCPGCHQNNDHPLDGGQPEYLEQQLVGLCDAQIVFDLIGRRRFPPLRLQEPNQRGGDHERDAPEVQEACQHPSDASIVNDVLDWGCGYHRAWPGLWVQVPSSSNCCRNLPIRTPRRGRSRGSSRQFDPRCCRSTRSPRWTCWHHKKPRNPQLISCVDPKSVSIEVLYWGKPPVEHGESPAIDGNVLRRGQEV